MSEWNDRRRDVVRLARSAGFPARDAEILAEHSRPAARLRVAQRPEQQAGSSRLGGLPELPAKAAWPSGVHGPMTFLGQVDLEHAAFLAGVDGWSAISGSLAFFVDMDPDADEVAGGRVVLVEQGAGERVDRPQDASPPRILQESPLAVAPVMTPPMWLPDGVELEHDLDADDWAAWDRLYEGLGCGGASFLDAHHQLLGNPWGGDMDPVWMGGVRFASDSEDASDPEHPFRLLAQFTTDHDAGLDFADAGVIYFVGRAGDFAAARFDRLVVFGESA